MTRHTVRGITSALAALTLTACGSSSPAGMPEAGSNLKGQQCCVAPASSGISANGIATVHNGWDIAFIGFQTPHDAIASEMATLALARAGSQRIKDLARKIDDEQGPRYQKMAAMADAWGEPVPSTDPAAGLHDHGGGDSSATDVDKLRRLSGSAFDKKFLAIMIAHHRATLPVATATFQNGTNPEAAQMSRVLEAAQGAELRQMEQMLAAR